MRSCAGCSAPCSCLTVVASEETWTEVEMGVVTGGDGPAVTAVPAPGSVFTVRAEEQTETFILIYLHYLKFFLLVFNTA